MIDGISFGKWKVEHNVFKIDGTIPLEDQIWELNEDILQAVCEDNKGNHYTLDIGWYPEFDVSGHFTIYIIKNYEWENPVVRVDCGMEDFVHSLRECIDYANRL